ncbi:MAG TPA: RsmD family RNA methyltransferase [Candidatus Dormibacteraeota bacterium]|nr:RsmD family RNA methyltransferase [Candidatus Dormibacteraeota bacterium]
MPARPRRKGSSRTTVGARLTGGEAAGRRLLTEVAPDLRATTGLARAACFNILGAQVEGVQVVDLFAGAGSLGLEALSRGARSATFVELGRRRAKLIEANLVSLGWADRAEVVVGDAISWLRRQREVLTACRLVLLDPPYREAGPQLCLDALGLLGGVAAAFSQWDPLVVAEHHRNFSVPPEVGALNCVRTARYGTTALSFYRRLP